MSAPKLPIKIDATSNGEFMPLPPPAFLRQAKQAAAQAIGDNARRLGRGRRAFLASLAGAATTLATFQQAFAARGLKGGSFRLAPEAPFEEAAAADALAGDEFILDAQTHMVDPAGSWRQTPMAGFERVLDWWPQGRCGEADPTDCYSAEHFIKEIFLDSDTDKAVLSFIPSRPELNPLSMREADRVRRLIDAMDGAQRLFLHAMVAPNIRPLEAQREMMQALVESWPVAAWKTYTQWGPDGTGWRLDDPEIGLPFIEQARALGVKRICIHKGLPLRRMAYENFDSSDIGPVARRYPDVTFIAYHAGYIAGQPEGPYDPARPGPGIDRLIKGMQDNGVPANANVYAELGSTWRLLMRDPTSAAHAIGKLLKHVGEDRVLWGTDSIWYGSPQDQIQALRAFEISDAFVERHGYPRLTRAIKAKILGLNGAAVYGVEVERKAKRAGRDAVDQWRQAYREVPWPSFRTYGPRSRSEFLALERLRGNWPD